MSLQLSLERQVTNYTQEDMAYFQVKALEAPEPRHVIAQNFFTPFQELGVSIISSHEVIRLHHCLGIKPSADQLNELGAFVMNKLADRAERTISVPTLPAQILPKKRNPKGKAALTVAASPEVMLERRLAQVAAQEFYDLTERPKDVWLGSSHGAVQLARSRTWPMRGLLTYMEGVIESDATLLPETTELGRIAVAVLR